MANVLEETEPRLDPARTAARPPPDHPDRAVAANEVHARPTEALEVPLRASYLAVTVEPADREREVRHIADLCARFDVAGPTDDNAHFKVTLGNVRVKWERHTEFSAYTFTVPGVTAVPFSEPPTTLLPDIARALKITTDELLGTTPVKKAPRPRNTRLQRRLEQIEQLGAKEKRQVLQFIDTMIEREKWKKRANG